MTRWNSWCWWLFLPLPSRGHGPQSTDRLHGPNCETQLSWDFNGAGQHKGIKCCAVRAGRGRHEVKGGAGQNCDTTCASRSGCSEEEWPTSEEHFKDPGKRGLALNQLITKTFLLNEKCKPVTKEGVHNRTEEIAAQAGQSCETTQAGGAKFLGQLVAYFLGLCVSRSHSAQGR